MLIDIPYLCSTPTENKRFSHVRLVRMGKFALREKGPLFKLNIFLKCLPMHTYGGFYRIRSNWFEIVVKISKTSTPNCQKHSLKDESRIPWPSRNGG